MRKILLTFIQIFIYSASYSKDKTLSLIYMEETQKRVTSINNFSKKLKTNKLPKLCNLHKGDDAKIQCIDDYVKTWSSQKKFMVTDLPLFVAIFMNVFVEKSKQANSDPKEKSKNKDLLNKYFNQFINAPVVYGPPKEALPKKLNSDQSIELDQLIKIDKEVHLKFLNKMKENLEKFNKNTNSH